MRMPGTAQEQFRLIHRFASNRFGKRELLGRVGRPLVGQIHLEVSGRLGRRECRVAQVFAQDILDCAI